MQKIVKILPFFEPRIWGGSKRLTEDFHYETDIKPLGEVFNVIALRDQADCEVAAMNCRLSDLYDNHPDWFMCDTKELPIRVNILDPIDVLSIQLHPDDDFAALYNGKRGKPEAWVILDTIEGGTIEFGHQAKTRKEFIQKSELGDWDHLLNYLKVVKNGYIDIPPGTLHAIGKGILTYNISRNADCTLRLYDYDRIDPATGKKRNLHQREVYENVNIPDESAGFVQYLATHEKGLSVTRYVDEPGLYTLFRLQCELRGSFDYDRFMFLTCVDGEGTINDVHIRKGETILIPDKIRHLEISGNLDMFAASYRNKKAV